MMPKILHLIGQMERGGAERQLLHLTQALNERGWAQVAVTFNPGEVWDERLLAAGIQLFGVRRCRNRLWRLWQLSRIVRQQRPDIIHSWSGHTNVYARWIWDRPRLRRIFSFRFIPTVHGRTGAELGRVPHAGVYAAADCVVSNTRAALECARAAGVKMRRSEVVSNIVLTPHRAKPGEAVTAPRIAAAGALISLKAYDVLLRALGQLASASYAFELLLAGAGPERPRLEALAAHLEIGSRVRFLGGIDDVPALLSTSHLLVHPSRSEGLSNTILEAMAEGLPVVATRVGGTPELIADGSTGLMVPPDQPAALAAQIRLLLDAPRLRERLGEAGFAAVRDRCSIPSVTGRYERIYESVACGSAVGEGTPVPEQ